jgi:predicted transcriptional regulator
MAQNKTLFVEYFGDSPTICVLDFFIENDLYDYSKTDIFNETGIARTTLQEIIKNLLKKKIIIKTRAVGRAEMYKLNRGNPVVEEIVRFAVNVVTSAVKAEVAQEITA